MKYDFENALRTLRQATEGTRYDGALYLVGGFVRDEVMKRASRTPRSHSPSQTSGAGHADIRGHGESQSVAAAAGAEHGDPRAATRSADIDIVLESDAVELAGFLFRTGAALRPPIVYPRFGTAMITVAGCDVELVTARIESYSRDSRKPEAVKPGTLEQDALRRDFTINTLLKNLRTDKILDPTGLGLSDIAAGVIRTPTDATLTFSDDPLRMLRAIRFASRFGFRIEECTWNGVVHNASRLDIVSRERVRDEFNKILLSERPRIGLELLLESGLLARFLPELVETVGVGQNAFHSLPVWEHTLEAVSALVAVGAKPVGPNQDEDQTTPSGAPLPLRLATLFHDVGKPRTRTVTFSDGKTPNGEQDEHEGEVHFYRHEDVGAEMVVAALGRLRYSNDQIETVRLLVAEHMRIGEYSPTWTDAAVRRLIRDLGEHLDDLFAIHRADVAALSAEHRDMSRARELRARIAAILERQDITSLQSPLDGNDIMHLLDLPPGPEVRRAKDMLTLAVVEGRLDQNDREGAKRLLKQGSGETATRG